MFVSSSTTYDYPSFRISVNTFGAGTAPRTTVQVTTKGEKLITKNDLGALFHTLVNLCVPDDAEIIFMEKTYPR